MTLLPHPRRRQAGFNLYLVALFSAGFAALAMAALFSMRYDRNLFAEGLAKAGGLLGASAAGGAIASVKSTVGEAAGLSAGSSAAASAGLLRKCLIDGKAVISNTDCAAGNPTSKIIAIHDSHGFEAPKPPPRAETATTATMTSDPALDKALDKQLR